MTAVREWLWVVLAVALVVALVDGMPRPAHDAGCVGAFLAAVALRVATPAGRWA